MTPPLVSSRVVGAFLEKDFISFISFIALNFFYFTFTVIFDL